MRNADFRFLDTNSLILIGFWCALRWYFYTSVGEKIQKEMSLLTVLTCVHHPMSLSRTSGMRLTNWLFWACNFRVAINEPSDMTAGCKLQHLQFFGLVSLLIWCLWCAPLPCLSSPHHESFDYSLPYVWYISWIYRVCLCISRFSTTTLDVAA